MGILLMGASMESAIKFIKPTIITTLILYVTFAGLLSILAVLSWVSWGFVGEWLSRIGLVALLLALLSSAIALLTGLLRK
jgi:hypothetical protein